MRTDIHQDVHMEIENMKKLALSLSIFALTACGGGSDSGGNNDLTSNSSAKLDGVWKSTYNEGAEGIDEMYFVFTSGGLLTIYDYAGDSYDDYANCYWIGNAQFKSKGNNKYEISSLEAGANDDPETVTITVSGSFMTIVTEDGNTRESSQLVKSYLKESDLTPECNSTSSARTPQGIQKALPDILSIKSKNSIQ